MRQSSDDRVTIYLAIESTELTASDLTARLGVSSDREWGIGDVRGKTGKSWECHGWVLETTIRSHEHEGQRASELIPIAIEKFAQKLSPVVTFASLLGNSAQNFTVLSIIADEVPGVELSHSFLQLLASLGGTFQIDITAE